MAGGVIPLVRFREIEAAIGVPRMKDASRIATMSSDDREKRRQTPEARPDSTGTNARPRDTTIGQTGEGIPDDSGRPVQGDEAEAKRIEEKIRKL